MTIIYEINPPKVIQDKILSHKELSESVENLKDRAIQVGNLCDGIHLTDSVLGIPRVSPITAGFFIKNTNSMIKISASVRVRDRNIISITQTICDAILLNLNGILILKGDVPPTGPNLFQVTLSDNLTSRGLEKNLTFIFQYQVIQTLQKFTRKLNPNQKDL
jgi:homocysteine S-methyltransferase